MNKELHIWLKSDSIPEVECLYLTINDTQKALNKDVQIVNTLQSHFCSTTYIVKGYRIFVHMLDNEIIEITLGNKNKHTNREIGIRQNLEKLLLANEFGLATETR